MRKTVFAVLLYGATILVGHSAETTFPLVLSENRRHLVDQRGSPFLYNADTPWMIFTKLTEPEAKEYIARRKEQGFTALQVMLTGFLGMTNRAGELPFAGTPPEQDFTRPNERYFAHVDRVIAEAREQGLLLSIAPAWSGCCGEGWAGQEKDGSLKPLNANGVEKSRELGRWLGRRYGRFDHVMWILGGDNDPNNARAEIRALGLGLKETAPNQLITYHAASSHSSTDVWPADESWLDVSMVYSYFRGFNKAWNKNQPDVYEVSHAEYAKTPVRPFFLGESTYEGEHGAWGSAVQARKQAYWCLFGGGFGHAYGSPNWNMPAHWREVLDLPGAESLRHWRALLESRPWWKLVPDVSNLVAVEGRGAFATNDYAVTALAADGSFALSYLPTRRRLTIDLSKLSGERVKASWFNPRTGETSRIGEYTDKTLQAFQPSGDSDWVLVLDDMGDLSGHKLLVTSVRTGDTEVFIADPTTGDMFNVSRSPRSEDRYPCWSPDAKHICFTSDRENSTNLWVMDASGAHVRRLLTSPKVCYMPSWQRTPRGERIVFGMHGDKPEMASIEPDGSNLQMLGDGHDPTLSPDGTLIAYTGHPPEGGVTVYVMNWDGSGKRRLVPTTSRVGATFPNWSPDSKQLVYSFPVDEALELFVINLDGTGQRQLTTFGGTRVCTPGAWSLDGKWISFRRTDERYWSNPERMKAVYAEKPAEKRPVWVIRPDGSDARLLESLRFQMAIDGSRASWRPHPK